MTLRRKLIIVMSLAALVLLLQMLALGLLGPQRNLVSAPQESHKVEQRTLNPESQQQEDGHDSAQTTRTTLATPTHHHSNSSRSAHSTTPSFPSTSRLPSSTVTPSTTPITNEALRKKSVPSYKDLSLVTATQTVPSKVWKCDISRDKDAISAIHRAKSPGCKELIHNVTCLHKAKLLYDTAIRRTCLLGANPGMGVSYAPLGVPGRKLGKGLDRDVASKERSPPVRIVFLLSVHGRAVRQVKRLFKALYHSDHYYYVHVDSRSDYMYRKLYEDMSDYPNVYFPTWRMATIWGGASLLQMMLATLTDLEKELTDWSWDYLINLSESDYPIRTNDDLVEFLSQHRGKNFVKTHGGELRKFIMKQGLDRTFVECDNHMWRVGNRPLPPDINVDGGSDWIAIHRNFSRYLVTGTDPLLVGLKTYYRYSLLPAESFFHTVLRNGHMCHTFIKTNLRVTNWNRKLGCRCQYKHIVDWCGCSPNDFLTRDIPRLKAVQGHHFIARKFEAIVSQEVIEQLDAHLYKPLPPDTPSLKSYWENIYHSEDDITKPADAAFTVYQSFLRTILKHLYSRVSGKGVGVAACGIPHQAAVKEVQVLRKEDELVGVVVVVNDALSDALNGQEFEALFTPVLRYRGFEYDHKVAKRILQIEVGSHWDGKESIFRNYARILGVWDEPTVALRLTAGEKGEVKVLWYDPLNVQVGSHVLSLEGGAYATSHTPKVDRPIRPGVWTVKVELGAKGSPLLAQVSFLVVPLTHTEQHVLTAPQQVNAKRVPSGGKELLHPSFPSWKKNVGKSGLDLEQWVDDLASSYWRLKGACRSGEAQGAAANKGDSPCGGLDYCVDTEWSTLHPDPKSELPRLSEVGANGRIR